MYSCPFHFYTNTIVFCFATVACTVEEQAQMIAADYSDATAGKVFVLVLSVSLTVVVVSSIVTLAGS